MDRRPKEVIFNENKSKPEEDYKKRRQNRIRELESISIMEQTDEEIAELYRLQAEEEDSVKGDNAINN